jgi:hypothetical protein
MSESSGRGIVQMENGPLAEVTFNPDGTYEVNKILRKSVLGQSTLAEIGKLIAEAPLDETGTARVDLV